MPAVEAADAHSLDRARWIAALVAHDVLVRHHRRTLGALRRRLRPRRGGGLVWSPVPEEVEPAAAANAGMAPVLEDAARDRHEHEIACASAVDIGVDQRSMVAEGLDA